MRRFKQVVVWLGISFIYYQFLIYLGRDLLIDLSVFQTSQLDLV